MCRIFLVSGCLCAAIAAAWGACGCSQQKSRADLAFSQDYAGDLARGNNQFAFDFYRQVAKEAKPDRNIFFSPYSIRTALAMTYPLAGQSLREGMVKILRFDRNQERFHPAYGALSRDISSPGKGLEGEINVANAIWVESSNLAPGFKKVMDEHYSAGLRIVDFGESEKAREIINRWVSDQTRDKIKDLLPQGAIDLDIIMVLTNAIYFRANWLIPFEKRATHKENFYCSPEKTVTVPMMRLMNELRYANVDIAELVELPYAGKRFSLVIILPRNHRDLRTVEEQLNNWDDWLKRLETYQVNLTMPRVKLTEAPELKSLLNKLGLALKDPAYHKATIEIDETGTTAAAASAVTILGSDNGLSTARVKVDHPYLLMLRDTQTGVILFAGRVVNPGVN